MGVRQTIVDFLISQGESNIPKRLTVNSLRDRYGAMYPDFFESLNLPTKNANLADNSSLSSFDDTYDNYQEDAPRVLSTVHLEQIKPSRPKILPGVESERPYRPATPDGMKQKVPIPDLTEILPPQPPAAPLEHPIQPVRQVKVPKSQSSAQVKSEPNQSPVSPDPFLSLKELLVSVMQTTKGKVNLKYKDLEFTFETSS